MPSIPLEIEETILDLLAEDDEGHSALKTCSLVCHAFLPICRKHIFENIVLNAHNSFSSNIHAFERLVRETPEIADYVRKLDYTIRNSDLTSSPILESLKRVSRLEFLTVRRQGWNTGFGWRNCPIRPAFLHLLHLPTLTHLKLSEIEDFVASDLIPCVNLRYLDIGIYMSGAYETTFPAVFPKHSIHLNEFLAGIRTSVLIMKLCKAQRPDGQPIINFGSLSKITVAIDEIEASQELFSRCRALTDVHISFTDPRKVMPSLADLLRPSMQTLKRIVVNTCVSGDDNPLFGILSEFENMCIKNMIETVSIGILFRMNANCYRGDDWGRLDEVLTSPGWLSLKRVSLAMEISSFNSNSELEVALRKLPETQFLRLSSSNFVSFDFEVIIFE